MDTIFALATAPGRSGVSIVRVSGACVRLVAEELVGSLPRPRQADLRVIQTEDGNVLDSGVVLFFEGPGSFTGEDVLEFQTHGSPAVTSALLRRLAKIPDCRLAEPGEFTRRALQNGKLDLTQVEGLADLIDAQTEEQRVQAQRVFSGGLGELIDDLRKDLIRAAALLAAVIDFADEDVPEDVSDEVVVLVDRAISIMESEVEGQKVAERVRNGFEVAIIGSPNVGKSTLLNALAGRDAAITSEHAGTTRDVIEVQMDLAGLPVTFLDTAGLRDANDPIEKIGIQRALNRAVKADLRVVLLESDERSPIDLYEDDLVLRAKGDLSPDLENGVSGLTGLGVEQLVERISIVLGRRVAGSGIATHERHAFAFFDACGDLKQARKLVLLGEDQYDIAAEEIRSSLSRLDSVIGLVDVENLLDVIFSSFCLGK